MKIEKKIKALEKKLKKLEDDTDITIGYSEDSGLQIEVTTSGKQYKKGIRLLRQAWENFYPNKKIKSNIIEKR